MDSKTTATPTDARAQFLHSIKGTEMLMCHLKRGVLWEEAQTAEKQWIPFWSLRGLLWSLCVQKTVCRVLIPTPIPLAFVTLLGCRTLIEAFALA